MNGQYIPVSSAAARLLGPIGIAVGAEAGLGKVTGEVLLRRSSAVGKANVVTVTDFVRAGHWRGVISTKNEQLAAF